MKANFHGTAQREEKRWLRHHRLFIVPFIYIEKGKSYGDRLRKNGSCVLSFLNHQRRLNYSSILSVELIAETPKVCGRVRGRSPVDYCLGTTIF